MKRTIVLTYSPPAVLLLLTGWVNTVNLFFAIVLMAVFTAYNFIVFNSWARNPPPRVKWHQKFAACMTIAGIWSVIWDMAKAIEWP